jgi:hypothetical protein
MESFLHFLRVFHKSFPKHFNQLLLDATNMKKDTKRCDLLKFPAAFSLGKILHETKEYNNLLFLILIYKLCVVRVVQAVEWYTFAASIGEKKEKRLAVASQMSALSHYDILQAQNLLKQIQQECILSPERSNDIGRL